MTVLLIKQSRLVGTIRKPDKIFPVLEWSPSCCSHLKTRQIYPAFGCHSITRIFDNQTQIDHLKTGLVRYSDVDCIFFSQLSRGTYIL
jgi:hypothetical protein